MFLPAELFTKRELDKPENSDTPEDFLTDQQDEKPRHSEENTREGGEAKVGHKRGRKLRKVSCGLECRGWGLPAGLSEAGQLVLPLLLANSASVLRGRSL